MLKLRLTDPSRAPSAVACGTATEPGFVVRFHKIGADGSGKCTLVAMAGESEGRTVRRCIARALRLVSQPRCSRRDRARSTGKLHRKVDAGAGGFRSGRCPRSARTSCSGVHDDVTSARSAAGRLRFAVPVRHTGSPRRATKPTRYSGTTQAASSFISSNARSCKHQALAPGLRNRIAELLRGIDPEPHRIVDIPERSFLTVAVRHAPRKLRHFGNKVLILVAPVENDLVLMYQSSLPFPVYLSG